jgi:adenylate kinase
MILLFGAAGSGKSVQGKLIADKLGWRWLSIGQLLREIPDPKIQEILSKGLLVDKELTYKIMGEAAKKAEEEVGGAVFDGFPRDGEQAEWLVGTDLKVDLAIVINIPREETIRRLNERGRADDKNPEVVERRLKVYDEQIGKIRQTLESDGVVFVDIDGTGTIEQTHEKIMKEVEKCGLA